MIGMMRRILTLGLLILTSLAVHAKMVTISYGPLLKTKWTQHFPMNALLPQSSANSTDLNTADAKGGRCVTGCAATAYAQYVAYHQWPARLDDNIYKPLRTRLTSFYPNVYRLNGQQPINWEAMVKDKSAGTEAQTYESSRAQLLVDIFADMLLDPDGSASTTVLPMYNPWYENIEYYKNPQPNAADFAEKRALFIQKIKESCAAGCVLPAGINSSAGAHVGVVDGYREYDDGTSEFHVDFGWGGNSYTTWYSSQLEVASLNNSLSGVYAFARPKRTVQIDPIAAVGGSSATLSFHSPWIYDKEVSGFTLKTYKASTSTSTWTDNFDSLVDETSVKQPNSSYPIAVKVEDGALQLFAAADRIVTYTWPDVLVPSEESVFACETKSYYTKDPCYIQVKAGYNDWETIYSYQTGVTDTGYVSQNISLEKFAGQPCRFRVYMARAKWDGRYNVFGYFLKDLSISNVKTFSQVGTTDIASSERSATISDLENGAQYAFTITPKFEGDATGVESLPVYRKVSASIPETAALGEIKVNDKALTANTYAKACFKDSTTIKVTADAATTELKALSGNLSVVADEDVAVEREGNTFTVTITPSAALKAAVGKTDGQRIILTLEALDDVGNVDAKDIVLAFCTSEDEKEPEPEATYFTVTFDSNGGSAVPSQQVKQGSSPTNPPDPTREGFTFDGWRYYGNAITPSQISVQGNVTLTASWTAIVTGYTVSFNLNGGTGNIPDQFVAVGNCATKPATNPTRDGYVFNGWALWGANYTFTQVVTSDICLMAIWEPEQKETPEEPEQGGDGESQTVTITLEAERLIELTTSNVPKGCDLIIQAVDNENDSRANKVKISADLNVNSITFKGTGAVKDKIKLMQSYNKYKLKANTFYVDHYLEILHTYPTYTFLEVGAVYLMSGFTITGTTTELPTIQSYAGGGPASGSGSSDTPAQKVTYTVTFVLGNGQSNITQKVSEGDSVSNPGTPTWSGYTFTGWKIGSSSVTFPYTPTADTTITASWKQNEVVVTNYTVTFKVGETTYYSTTVSSGSYVSAPTDPSKDGYIFNGWSLGSVILSFPIQVNGNMTLTAAFTEIPTGAEPIIQPVSSFVSGYNYQLTEDYWDARKQCIIDKKTLFVLSGSTSCNNCTYVKNYLQSHSDQILDKFVVYYAKLQNGNVPMQGRLPQYGAYDARTIDAFTGTIDEKGNFNSKWAWYSGRDNAYYSCYGWAEHQVVETIAAANGKTYGTCERIELRGPSAAFVGSPAKYQLVAIFDDGTEMNVDHGVEWSVASGSGSITYDDGTDYTKNTLGVGSLTAAGGTKVVIRARNTFYNFGLNSNVFEKEVKVVNESDVTGLEITSLEFNLEDSLDVTLKAKATLSDGSTADALPTWTVALGQVYGYPSDSGLSSVQSPYITISDTINGKLEYFRGKKTVGGQSINYVGTDVQDHDLAVTATLNGITKSASVKVYGPSRMWPTKWSLITGDKIAPDSIIRVAVSELKYTYKGKIYTTTDSGAATYDMWLQINTSGATVYGSTVMQVPDFNITGSAAATLHLYARKTGGKYTGHDDKYGDTRSPTYYNKWVDAYGVTDMSADDDGDGFTNAQEKLLGTEPNNPNSRWAYTSSHFDWPDSIYFRIMFMSSQYPGRTYQIEGSKDGGKTWVVLGTAEGDKPGAITDADVKAADECKLFRVKVTNNTSGDWMYVSGYGVWDGQTLTVEKGTVYQAFVTDANDEEYEIKVQITGEFDEGDEILKIPSNVPIASTYDRIVCANEGMGLTYEKGNIWTTYKVVSLAADKIYADNNKQYEITPYVKKVIKNGSVVLVLNEDKIEEIKPNIENIDLVGSANLSIANPIPGLYYSVLSGNSLDEITNESPRQQATGEEALMLNLPKVEGETKFYKVKVSL